MTRFIKLPFRLHASSKRWVPPLVFERRAFLDRNKNPFFEHAECEYFLAERDRQLVGRCCAHIDERWDEYRGGNDGFFGLFECENDPEAAKALLDTAAAWLSKRGRERIIGPMDFTTNDECGVLVDGFDEPAMILEPWHPPYYGELLEAQSLTKVMDLLMWDLWLGDLKQGNNFHDFIEEAALKAETEHGVTIRAMRKSDLKAEVKRFTDVYNEAWGQNWGFVPITDAEVDFQAKNLKPVLEEQWTMIAEKDGEVIGAALTLPDINQVLIKMKGRLLPFGWWHFLTGRRKIDAVRVFALGVLPAHQHTGTAAAFYVKHRQVAAVAREKGGHTGWILETNEAMNRAMEGMGGTVSKRYRIYERPLP